MKYHLTKTFFTGQKTMIEHYGDEIWETMCDHLPTDRYWTTKECVDCIVREFNYSQVTASQYCRAILHNVMAESNDVVKRNGNRWRFV